MRVYLLKKINQKHCDLKETLLVLSNFFFCHNVFKSHLLQRRQKASIYRSCDLKLFLNWMALDAR